MNRTMTDEEVLRAAVSNLAIDDPTWTMEEARAIMRDSGEHDTLDDQIAYEQEHGTREYRLAEELHREMGHALTMMAFSNCATTRDVGRWHAKVQQLRDALAPRPPITPTGSIDDVPWTETDQ